MAEDSEEDEILFFGALRRSGLTNPVNVVLNGEEAISYLSGDFRYRDRDRFPLPRILLLDLAMPKVDGWQVLRWARSRPQFDDILIVVLAGAIQVHELRNAYRMGADSFLIKPCTVEDLWNLEKAFPAQWTRPALNRGSIGAARPPSEARQTQESSVS